MSSPCRPCRLKTMTDVDAAWLAGLVEGEGTLLVQDTHRGYNAVRIGIGMTDCDVLARCVALTGLGRVRPINVRHINLGTKPQWYWYVGAKADVRALALRLMPWFGERRTAQAQAILDETSGIVTSEEGVCLQGHQIVGLHCTVCNNEKRRITA